MEMLRSELPKYGGIFVQAEDELAAVAYALGFAYSGHLAVTGSSGPGLSLKMEALGWAVMAEMPLIVDQRAARRPEHRDADERRAERPSAGDLRQPRRRPARRPRARRTSRIASTSRSRPAGSPASTARPVIILTDQALATRIEAFDEPDLAKLMVDPKPDLSPRGADYKPYPLDRITRHAPPGASIGHGQIPDRERPRARRTRPPDRQSRAFT